MKKKNFFQCWECRRKGIDCYCNLDSKKENLKKVNEIIENEIEIQDMNDDGSLKELNLSEKRTGAKSLAVTRGFVYPEKDVKEFIRRLKIKIKSKVPYERWAIVGLEIDKLAGEKLI